MTSPRLTGSRESSEAGYTLVETAIALVITTIVVSAGYSSYIFMQRIVADWQNAVWVENAAHRIIREVTRQLRQTEMTPATSRGILELTHETQTVRYRLHGRALTRNDRPMHAPAVDVLVFEVTMDDGRGMSPACASSIRRESTSSGMISPKAANSSPRRSSAPSAARLVQIRLRLAARRDTMEVCTAVRPRPPSSWP